MRYSTTPKFDGVGKYVGTTVWMQDYMGMHPLVTLDDDLLARRVAHLLSEAYKDGVYDTANELFPGELDEAV